MGVYRLIIGSDEAISWESQRGKYSLGTGDTAHGEPAGLVADVDRSHRCTIEVQVIRVVTIVHSRGPIVPVGTAVVRGRTVPVARKDEVVRIFAPFIRCRCSRNRHPRAV